MLSNIDVVQYKFDKAVNSYDKSCMLQDMVCLQLLQMIKKHATCFNKMVDLGCGTGNSTKYLVYHLTFTKLAAVDVAGELLRQAKMKLAYPKIEIINADFQCQIFPENSIQLAFANMSLQWSGNLYETIKVIYKQIAKNGFIAFSLPIKGTFLELRDGYKNEFYTLIDVKNLLINNGFNTLEAQVGTYNLIFESPIGALRSIKNVGANFLKNRKTNISLLGKNSIKEYFNPEYYSCIQQKLTYQMGFFIAKK